MPAGEFGKCCEDCQFYWTCETKWYRGEKHEEDACCPICNYHSMCKDSGKSRRKQR